MYEANYAKKIKVGIFPNENANLLQNFLNESIFDSIKICQSFQLETTILEQNVNYDYYNFLFYITTFNKIANESTINEIKSIKEKLIHPRNHLFIVVDQCNNLQMNDDDELVFQNEDENESYQTFDKTISKLINDNLFHLSNMSIELSTIWKTIENDSSIVNLSEDQVDLIAKKLLKKSSKMSLIDKKREIKSALKKVSINDKLAESGYNDFSEYVTQYFKLPYQKKIIYHNYLFAFNQTSINFDNQLDNINNLLKEIYDINYFKSDMYDDLLEKINSIFFLKLKNFYFRYKNNVEFNPANILNTCKVDVYIYHQFLLRIINMAKDYNLADIMTITNKELETINDLITNHHKKEMEHVTDLDKISSYLEIFASKDRNNLNQLFDKIRTYPKIILENFDHMDKWINFINRCLKIGIQRDLIINLIEEIIMNKIMFYCDISKTSGKEIVMIYPQCLQSFLVSNMSKNFVFVRLYMYACHNIRYSGRNILDFIKNLNLEQYQNLLKLEYRLLELCSITTEEQSQRMNLSELEIVETFNENNLTAASPNSQKTDSNSESKKTVKKKVQIVDA